MKTPTEDFTHPALDYFPSHLVSSPVSSWTCVRATWRVGGLVSVHAPPGAPRRSGGLTCLAAAADYHLSRGGLDVRRVNNFRWGQSLNTASDGLTVISSYEYFLLVSNTNFYTCFTPLILKPQGVLVNTVVYRGGLHMHRRWIYGVQVVVFSLKIMRISQQPPIATRVLHG